jgi:branched-chain amino acid aminotransferase
METALMNINITKTTESKISQFDENDINFARIYTDHMLVADYEDGEWKTPEIMPFGNMTMHPATTFIHYGQSIFEGIKAYKSQDGSVNIFRPADNFSRFNISAKRMAMAEVPEEIFMGGLKTLVNLDQAWVPGSEGSSLYLRPFLFATDEFIGVRPPTKFRFMIIMTPAGAYYNKAIDIYVQDKYVRAFPGGVGFAKAAGNYAAAMQPTVEVNQMGYDQNLWLDGVERKYIEEIGTMNVFFVIGDKVVTPSLESETILNGFTRLSVISLLRDKGIEVVERKISIQEIEEASAAGTLKEAFGAGTAAVIAPINSLTYKENKMSLPPQEEWSISPAVKQELADIRYGRSEDKYNWMFPVGA